MTALALCILAFGATYYAGRKSLGLGISVLLAVGYFYGIVRANVLATLTYFLFDGAVLALYLSQKWGGRANQSRSGALGSWLLLLLLWPCLLIFVPTQPVLVSLVGLRASTFFLPMAWFGSRLRSQDLQYLSFSLAVLNLAALGFAAAEYVLGVPRFYPLNATTFLIYMSADVAGGFLRIPAIFSSAHAFGATMVGSIPFLVGAWEHFRARLLRILMLAGIAAAMLGVLMSATRLNFIIGTALLVLSILKGGMKAKRKAIFMVLIAGVTVVALRNERFQRFKTLSDTDMVEERVHGSVNRGFFEILLEYPLGNGLGGGGTSVPYFLQGQVRTPISTENEYERILCEQGIIGLLLWVGFIGWFFARYRVAFRRGPWQTTRRMIWLLSAVGLATSAIGNGTLTSIPATVFLLLGIGFTVCPMPSEVPAGAEDVRVRSLLPSQHPYRPAPSTS